MIAEIMRRLHAETGAPVHTSAIRTALLSHPVGRTLVLRAWERRERDDPPDWWAMAIRASFAQSIERGTSPWARQFAQTGAPGDYSYAPR